MYNTIENQQFFDSLAAWLGALPERSLNEVLVTPQNCAIVSVDVINGFCYEGALSSPRVKEIVTPIRRLFESAWKLGLRNIVLTQDTHEPDSVEFAQFPPHCIRGTEESQTVPEFRSLPFFDQITVFEKNSIHSGLNTGLQAWVEAHPQVDTFIVVGDCTDLCTYQLAMHLRLDANARQLRRRVIVPANCVQTYDMTVAAAEKFGAVPHPGDLLHDIFLYHMNLNGIEVLSSLELK
jgi:nicotinamidase-related amidase